jgi:hypothetical protein
VLTLSSLIWISWMGLASAVLLPSSFKKARVVLAFSATK